MTGEHTKNTEEKDRRSDSVHEDVHVPISTFVPNRKICIPVTNDPSTELVLEWAIDTVINPATDLIILLHVRVPFSFVAPLFLPHMILNEQTTLSAKEESHNLLKRLAKFLISQQIHVKAIALQDPNNKRETI